MVVRGRADPITTEIIRGALVAITDEMKTTLQRTAYSTVIYEGLDFTVGLFDARGETISIGIGLPTFIHGLSETVKAKIKHFGIDGFSDGDIVITNDAYVTGSHLNHIVLTLPIFSDGELVAFASTMGHWQDIGATLGVVTSDIFSEGLQIPITKLYSAGTLNDFIVELISANVRFPANARGDLRAQVASIRTGEHRLRALVERYGTESFHQSIEAVYDQTEQIARQFVSRIPDGSYRGSAFMDNDGISNEPIPINVLVTVDGDEMTVDLTDVGSQVAGYYNSAITTGVGACQVAFRCLTSPRIFPINDGAYRALHVILPPGRIVSAEKPAAMQRWMIVPMTIIDCIFLALSEVIPNQVIAGHHADLCSRRIYGVDYRTNRFFFQNGGAIGGGWGAKFNSDGVSGTICLNDGDTHGRPIETMERRLPVIIEQYRLRQDSGGAGEFRGGLGVEQRSRFLSRTNVDVNIERTQCPPWGLQGGKAGLPNRVRLIKSEGPINPSRGKLPGLAFETGETFVIESGGGGGFGDPLNRPGEKVAADVVAEYVSITAARDNYGVVVGSDGVLDEKATLELRKNMRAAVD